MKDILNWRKATVFDCEADALLEEATKLHVLSFEMVNGKSDSISGENKERLIKFFEWHIINKIPVVAHRGILYDIPLCEKLLDIDLKDLIVIDTLAISWYLNTKREVHGLDSFFEDYGIAKPKVDDWENLSYEEYKHRCQEDVKINVALWKDFIKRLHEIYSMVKVCVDSGKVNLKRMSKDEVTYLDQFVGCSTVDQFVERCLTFLMFKMDCSRLQEKTRWKVDTEYLQESFKLLDGLIQEAKSALEAVMPPVAKYGFRKKPEEPLKKDGTPKQATLKWNTAVEGLDKKDQWGNPITKVIEGEPNRVKVINKYEAPNANSVSQLKDFFFSHGWKPRNFKFVKDEEAMEKWVKGGFKKSEKPIPRKVPQISIDGDNGKELCPSIVELAETVPEVLMYNSYTTIKHRLDIVKGFQRDMSDDGYLQARIGGYTNTLRVQHRECVNLPSVDKPYGENIRGALTCLEDEILLGSDLSSLEDRTKHHFMLPHDPEYVKTMMADDYDPHILTAHSANLVTDEELEGFKKGTLSGAVKEAVGKARKGGKVTNYACLPVENSEVLTDKGWKSYWDINVGDIVLTYNTDKGVIEEDEILNKVFLENKDIVRMSNKHWSIESTGDHRWYGWQRKAKGHTRTNNLVRYKDYGFKTTDSINSEFNILTSAKYPTTGKSNITKEEASFMGWLLSDGYYKWSKDSKRTSSSFGKKRGIVGLIAQAQHKFTEEVEECLEKVGADYTIHLDDTGVKTSTVNKYCFKSEWFRGFIDRVVGVREDKHEVDWVSWIMSLSEEARESFLYSFWLADGTTKGKTFNKNMVITQNEGNICDAVMLSMFFMGCRVTNTSKSDKCRILTQISRPHVTTQEFSKEFVGKKDVFCITTNNSTFITRQNGNITITGNCVYGGSPNAIAQGGGIDLNVAKKLHKGYWELNWSVKAIAEEQCVFEDSKGQKWLINPINGISYSLRTEKDRFSTLCQGTGSFFFDMWVDRVLDQMENEFGYRSLTGSFHDEIVLCFKDLQGYRERYEKLVLDSIDYVSDKYMLRRRLGADVQFDKRYSGIH